MKIISPSAFHLSIISRHHRQSLSYLNIKEEKVRWFSSLDSSSVHCPSKKWFKEKLNRLSQSLSSIRLGHQVCNRSQIIHEWLIILQRGKFRKKDRDAVLSQAGTKDLSPWSY